MKSVNIPLRSEDVREKNEKIILRSIQLKGVLSQSEAVTATGLKAPTVLRIFTYLEEQGLIEVSDKVPPQASNPEKKGRKPIYYHIKSSAYYAVGIEFWSRQFTLIVTDFRKNIVYKHSITEIQFQNTEQVLEIIRKEIDTALQACSLSQDQILGVGIGAPGRIDTEKGTIIYYSRIPDMLNFPLGELLGETYTMPIYLNNNASVVAMNAYKRGAAKEAQSLMTILIRSGVGGAMIDRGKPMMTKGKTALEIGHTTIDLHGPLCSCGSHGCMEAYISENVLIEECVAMGFGSLENLETLVQKKEPEAVKLVTAKGDLLGVEARNLYRMLSPESFLILTRYPGIAEIYAQRVQDAVNSDYFSQYDKQVSVHHDVYDPVEACQGAVDLVFDHFFGLL